MRTRKPLCYGSVVYVCIYYTYIRIRCVGQVLYARVIHVYVVPFLDKHTR